MWYQTSCALVVTTEIKCGIRRPVRLLLLLRKSVVSDVMCGCCYYRDNVLNQTLFVVVVTARTMCTWSLLQYFLDYVLN